MTNLKFFLVTYDRLDHSSISNLSPEEKKMINCYAVNSMVPKFISAKVPVINEWNLKWYNSRYQTLQYYEYGTVVHCVKNPELIEGLTHVGLLHYDIEFQKDSINDMISILDKNPNTIFYICKREKEQLFFNIDQLKHLCEFMSKKLDMKIDYQNILDNGWISEALSVTPIDVYTKFGQYIIKYQYEIESLLNNNTWGLMDIVKHRLCGFTERMWGIYLVSLGMDLQQMNVKHEWDKYHHKHLEDKEKFLNKF